MKSALFHIHTNTSIDAICSIEAIAKKLIDCDIKCAVITDHDSIDGSLKLREYCRIHGIDVDIPIAAEYKTNVGDIIAVNIRKPILNRNITPFLKEVKSQGGITILPHPYDSHYYLEDWVKKIDIIEVFNSRSSDYNNQRSLDLANTLAKPKIYGSDAHFIGDITNAIMGWKSPINFLSAVLENEIVCTRRVNTTQNSILRSNIVKNVRLYKCKNTLELILKYCYFNIKDYKVIQLIKRMAYLGKQ